MPAMAVERPPRVGPTDRKRIAPSQLVSRATRSVVLTARVVARCAYAVTGANVSEANSAHATAPARRPTQAITRPFAEHSKVFIDVMMGSVKSTQHDEGVRCGQGADDSRRG